MLYFVMRVISFCDSYCAVHALKSHYDAEYMLHSNISHEAVINKKLCLLSNSKIIILLGFQTARALALHGALVILACRDIRAGFIAAEKITKEEVVLT